MKKGLVLLMSLFTCLMLVGCDKKKPSENPDDNGNVVDNGNNDNGEIKSVQLKNEFKEIKLTKEKETYKFNDLTLEFYGEDVSSETNIQSSYKYVLAIKLGDIEINSNIYSNPYKRLINSSNLASNFYIYMVDDLYILKSSTGAQRDGENALIFDKDGNFKDSFEDIGIKIDIENRLIDYTNCITEDLTEECRKEQYKILTNTIEKQ